MGEGKFKLFITRDFRLCMGDPNLPGEVWATIHGFMSPEEYSRLTDILMENVKAADRELTWGILREHLKRDLTTDDLLRIEKKWKPNGTAYDLIYCDEQYNRVTLGEVQLYYQEPNMMRVFYQQRYIKIKFKHSNQTT